MQPNRREFLRIALAASLSTAAPAASLRGQERKPGALAKSRRCLRWREHRLAEIPRGYQVAVADADGDGRPDVFALSSEASIVEWYQNPTWTRHVITTRTHKNISLAPLRRKGRAGLGLALAADFSLEDSTQGGTLWWAEPAGTPDDEWSLRRIGEVPTSHRLRWADIEGTGRPVLIDAPIVGYGAKAPDYTVGARLTWFELPDWVYSGRQSFAGQETPQWVPHLIDDSLTIVHGINVLDWDGDGRDELLTASVEGIHLFHSLGEWPKIRWSKTRLAAGATGEEQSFQDGKRQERRRGASEIAVGKIGGQRFIATIEPWHGEKVAVYFEGKSAQLWSRHGIDASLRDGHALACGDLDGDGNDEIVAGFRGVGTSLYVYSATDSSGLKWDRQTLDTEMAASGVVLEDLNGDGRLDVVAIGASTGNVKYYENLG